MRKFKGELWAAACVALVTSSTGIALAGDPYGQQQPQQPQQPQEPAVPEQEPAVPEQEPAVPEQEPVTQEPGTPTYDPGMPVQQEPEYEYESDTGMMADMRRVGFSLSLGGGVTDFTDSDMRDTTGVGGSWAVRATFGTRTPIGFEASYFGSAQSIDALGLDDDAVLVSNGLQGALRLNAVVNDEFSPYIFGGAAWARYNLTNEGRNTSAIEGEDDVLEIPVGIGIGGSWMGFAYDLRGELRFATNENMVPESLAGRPSGDDADMHRWGVNATIGYGW